MILQQFVKMMRLIMDQSGILLGLVGVVYWAWIAERHQKLMQIIGNDGVRERETFSDRKPLEEHLAAPKSGLGA